MLRVVILTYFKIVISSAIKTETICTNSDIDETFSDSFIRKYLQVWWCFTFFKILSLFHLSETFILKKYLFFDAVFWKALKSTVVKSIWILKMQTTVLTLCFKRADSFVLKKACHNICWNLMTFTKCSFSLVFFLCTFLDTACNYWFSLTSSKSAVSFLLQCYL